MKIWRNNPENVNKAQAIFLERAKLCSEASLGELQLNEENNTYTQNINNIV